jgi:hypothetical protein
MARVELECLGKGWTLDTITIYLRQKRRENILKILNSRMGKGLLHVHTYSSKFVGKSIALYSTALYIYGLLTVKQSKRAIQSSQEKESHG